MSCVHGLSVPTIYSNDVDERLEQIQKILSDLSPDYTVAFRKYNYPPQSERCAILTIMINTPENSVR